MGREGRKGRKLKRLGGGEHSAPVKAHVHVFHLWLSHPFSHHMVLSGTCSPTPHPSTPPGLLPLPWDIPCDMAILSKLRDYLHLLCPSFFFPPKASQLVFSSILPAAPPWSQLLGEPNSFPTRHTVSSPGAPTRSLQ